MTAAVLAGALVLAALLIGSGAAAPAGRLHSLGALHPQRSGETPRPRLVGRWRRRDRATEVMRWVTAVRRLAALLHAGRAPATVFAEITPGTADPTARWITRVCQEVHAAALVGIPVSTTLGQFARRPAAVGDRVLGATARSVCAQLAACWEISERSGSSLARTLSGVAESLESQLDAQAARESALAGPRVTVRTLSWLPVLALGLGVLMGTDPVSTLLTTVWGRIALAAGAGLSIAGRLWTRSLMHRAEGVNGS
ncbi:type II secretion system F family protein [Kocuria rhizophila]|uniref:type II secretion system F family protein n=1 Tax=Kocuria rhizophila TaxID=72000 RepID=UPI001D2D3AD4|nr:type II secretion system F family protein [Kocuria rhizophila]MCC5671571.1 type II secretion system F family protein [Kocuria rhizophila]